MRTCGHKEEEFGRAVGIKYSVFGQGPPLVLLHGFGGKPADWCFLVKDLAPHFRVIIPSLSSLTLGESQSSFREQVDLLVSFINTVVGQNETVSLLGASYGGALVWAISASLGQRVTEAVYINPMPPYPGRFLHHGLFRPFLFIGRFEWISYAMLSTPPGKALVKFLLEVFYDEWPERVSSVGRLTVRHKKIVARILRRFNELVHRTDWQGWTGRIKQIQSKSLLIIGAKDKLFRHQVYRNLQRYLGDCEMVVIEELSHRVSGAVAPQIADLVCRRFIG